MKVLDTVPELGATIDWDIDEIMSRPSCDISESVLQVCSKCGAANYDDWGWVLDGVYLYHYNHPNGPYSHYCGDYAEDAPLAVAWEKVMEHKRGDDQYPDVLASIREHGFVRPASAWINNGELRFGDGHHRLAAAIELGMATVPVKVYSGWKIASDSGSWYSGEPIMTLEEFEESA